MVKQMSLEKPRSGRSPFGWFKGVRQEFGKISWTTRRELRAYTKIVAFSMLFMGLGIYAMDLAIRGALSGLDAVVRWMIGG